MNRLKLDFSLESYSDRKAFIDSYLLNFTPTSSEAETIANYLLWGQDETGKPVGDSIELPRKNKTWKPHTNEVSLEALQNVSQKQIIVQDVRRQPFDRELERSRCPDYLLPQLEDLFYRIDRTELLVSFYELEIGTRKKSIRPSLLTAVPPDELDSIRTQASYLSKPEYLKYKLLLVELRKEQYAMRDFYAPTRESTYPDQSDHEFSQAFFGTDISVYPSGLYDPIWCRPYTELNPYTLSKSEISQLRAHLNSLSSTPLTFDFTNRDHVIQLLKYSPELREHASVYNSSEKLLQTLDYYISLLELPPIYQDILDLKTNQYTNQEIVNHIKEKYGITYRNPYITTIYYSRIVEGINDVARIHRKILDVLTTTQDFQKCRTCGHYYIRDFIFFAHALYSKDKFMNQCKKCSKESRKKRKEKLNNAKQPNKSVE